MNFPIFCLIVLTALTFQICLAQNSLYDNFRYNTQPAHDSIESFRTTANSIVSSALANITTQVKSANHAIIAKLKDSLIRINNLTDISMALIKITSQDVQKSTKTELDNISKATEGYFNIIINAVKDRSINNLIEVARLSNQSLEAKAAILEQSLSDKSNDINNHLRLAVQDAYKAESTSYWSQIKATKMNEIILEVKKGVEAQVNAFLNQQFSSSISGYEQDLIDRQQFYIGELNKKVGELEAKKMMYEEELKSLTAALKMNLEAAKTIQSSTVKPTIQEVNPDLNTSPIAVTEKVNVIIVGKPNNVAIGDVKEIRGTNANGAGNPTNTEGQDHLHNFFTLPPDLVV